MMVLEAVVRGTVQLVRLTRFKAQKWLKTSKIGIQWANPAADGDFSSHVCLSQGKKKVDIMT